MAESDFSWLKVASFIGACFLLVLAIVVIATGITLIKDGSTFYGVATTISGVVCIISSVLVYKNYQKKSISNRA